MPSDYLLLINGINGESQAAGLKNYIDLESWSWGAHNAANVANKGLAAGKPSLSEFNVSCQVDQASYQIVKNLVSGTHVASATFVGRKTGGGNNPYTYLQITFTNVFITSTSIAGGSQGVPSMSITLAYEAIAYQYFTQDTANGAVTQAGEAKYNIAQAAVA